uniref:Uncharacterized protein n=1 Tax=Anguilla anguilla TaxID=7936 RepID=A0A0E9RT84_ANGAN
MLKTDTKEIGSMVLLQTPVILRGVKHWSRRQFQL